MKIADGAEGLRVWVGGKGWGFRSTDVVLDRVDRGVQDGEMVELNCRFYLSILARMGTYGTLKE